MDSLSNFFFGQNNRDQPPNPANRQIDHSMRGGLPKIIDMLSAFPSYSYNRKDLEAGNKVLLPPEVLEIITNQYHGNLPHPMVFSVSSLKSRKTVYVGVLEFIAPVH